MSLFSGADTGIKPYLSHFNVSHRMIADLYPGQLIPTFKKFCIPGDVWKIRNSMLIRFQPMFAPLLTDVYVTTRYFFVPLALVEKNTEKVITGSDNGKVITGELPVFKGVFDDVTGTSIEVKKYSLMDYLHNLPAGDYYTRKNNKTIPAQYWTKAYARLFFDYYRDENLDDFSDFEEWWETLAPKINELEPFYTNWKKDYLTASLYDTQKGTAPSMDISFQGNITIPEENYDIYANGAKITRFATAFTADTSSPKNNYYDGTTFQTASNTGINQVSSTRLRNNQITEGTLQARREEGEYPFDIGGGTFTVADLRTLFAQQRIFERLMRCGSRYTEYLVSNFGTSPADGTLQRAQYLGGFKSSIVTSEVLQTAEDGEHPVGTMRGHGIGYSMNGINTFHCNQFGVIIGVTSVMPKAQYTQGINREFTYKSRWDFFNPSLQFLTEQEVRNAEVYTANDGEDDQTFGFEEMYSELKSARDMICGDMRDTQSYWTMARHFAERPYLDKSFYSAADSRESFMQPFAVTDAPPIIMDCGNIVSVWRPMAKYGTPGLLDHN